jgi:hypothetical protein
VIEKGDFMFNDAIWEHIDRFTKAKKTSEIQQQLERFSHQMGFDYFRLLIIFPISMQKSHVALFNNCPTSWFDAYSERHYLTQDPVVFLGLKQTQPIFWNKLDCDAPWLPSASRGDEPRRRLRGEERRLLPAAHAAGGTRHPLFHQQGRSPIPI